MSGAGSSATFDHFRRGLSSRTPQGFDVSSRAQGHVFCARRPRIEIEIPCDPDGVVLEGPTPSGPTPAPAPGSVGFTYGYSSCSPSGNEGTVKPLRVSLVEPVAYLKDS